MQDTGEKGKNTPNANLTKLLWGGKKNPTNQDSLNKILKGSENRRNDVKIWIYKLEII